MIRDRFITLWNMKALSAKELERLTGIDREKWYSLRNSRRRMNEEDIIALNKIFPQYAYWLSTGQILPDAGQVSPDYEELARLEPQKSGTHD
jgi:hypothetical protein